MKIRDFYTPHITYKTNLGAAKFEKGDYEGCIQACNEAVEYGREILADFKIIAKYVTLCLAMIMR